MEPDDAQGFMMAVGKLKEGDILQLRYADSGSKPTAFERWSQLVELKVSSLHPEAAVYWQSVRMAAGAAYDQYLWLNPMQKVRVAVDITSIPARYIALEMKLRPAILAALPENGDVHGPGNPQIGSSRALVCSNGGCRSRNAE
jgi:hypothetical protein